MKIPEAKPRWHFVDEAGDANFYANRSKRLIIGEEGCSRVLIVGFLHTLDPQEIRSKLAEVRLEISTDRYLKDIPSVKKSLVYFHAKDDCPEVRKLVFEALDKMAFRAQVVVARKVERIFAEVHKRSQDKFYDDLVTRLFRNQLHLSTENYITFARRGTSPRQHALRSAVAKAAAECHKKLKKNAPSIIVDTSQPVQEPCLQAIDYVNWAVQRAYEKKEMRFFEFLRGHIQLLRDIFDFVKYEKHEKCAYNRTDNPFHIEKTSPLS